VLIADIDPGGLKGSSNLQCKTDVADLEEGKLVPYIFDSHFGVTGLLPDLEHSGLSTGPHQLKYLQREGSYKGRELSLFKFES
jgi:hypothetical protein